MALFHYPKSRHARTQRPRAFKRYQTYKRFLRIEFSGVCVYCRSPKISNPSQLFSVDHYRPQSLPRFAHLVTDYSNLYYCCHACNSRKGSYWPANEAVDPWIVNPCDFDMASHLKLDGKTAAVKHFTSHGKWTVELLELNSPEMQKYRRTSLTAVNALESQKLGLQIDMNRVSKASAAGVISMAAASDLIAEIKEQISDIDDALSDYGIGTIVPPVRHLIFGVSTVQP